MPVPYTSCYGDSNNQYHDATAIQVQNVAPHDVTSTYLHDLRLHMHLLDNYLEELRIVEATITLVQTLKLPDEVLTQALHNRETLLLNIDIVGGWVTDRLYRIFPPQDVSNEQFEKYEPGELFRLNCDALFGVGFGSIIPVRESIKLSPDDNMLTIDFDPNDVATWPTETIDKPATDPNEMPTKEAEKLRELYSMLLIEPANCHEVIQTIIEQFEEIDYQGDWSNYTVTPMQFLEVAVDIAQYYCVVKTTSNE